MTLMWGSAWERYGEKFVETFERHWPDEVELFIVTDRVLPTDRARQVQLNDVPGYIGFMDRYRDNKRANGYGHPTRKVDRDGRDWRHDAVLWAPQGLAPVAALDGLEDGDLFAWFDADVETTQDVPKHWLNVLLGGMDISCVQRVNQHSEIGFWAVRMGPGTRNMIEYFSWFYASDAVFKLPEWHSAYVFDRALEKSSGLSINNLGPEVRDRSMLRGHVWPQTVLAEFTVHKKGKLKDG